VGLCHIELGSHVDAVERLSKLMDIDPRYRDFLAALDYAEALWLDGRRDLALEVLEDIALTSTRIEHSLAYANYLALAEETARARQVLESALKDYEQSPTFVQRRDRGPAREAEKLLAQLG
jgi:tetratricopeptide (TPR) repeat protein